MFFFRVRKFFFFFFFQTLVWVYYFTFWSSLVFSWINMEVVFCLFCLSLLLFAPIHTDAWQQNNLKGELKLLRWSVVFASACSFKFCVCFPLSLVSKCCQLQLVICIMKLTFLVESVSNQESMRHGEVGITSDFTKGTKTVLLRSAKSQPWRRLRRTEIFFVASAQKVLSQSA